MCYLKTKENQSQGVGRDPDNPFVPGVTDLESLQDWVSDHIEDSMHTISDPKNKRIYTLFGDWITKDNKYRIDKDGEHGFSAVYHHHTGYVVVEWSKFVLRCLSIKPQFTIANKVDHTMGACGDLDMEGSRPAYCLPSDWFLN